MDTQTTALVPVAPASSSNMDLRAYCDHASKMRESSDIAQIAAALVRAQAALDSPPRNREVEVRTKTGVKYTFRYATLDQIMDAARPALGEAGLCVLQPIVSTEKGPVLVTRLVHESGQYAEVETGFTTLAFASNAPLSRQMACHTGQQVTVHRHLEPRSPSRQRTCLPRSAVRSTRAPPPHLAARCGHWWAVPSGTKSCMILKRLPSAPAFRPVWSSNCFARSMS